MSAAGSRHGPVAAADGEAAKRVDERADAMKDSSRAGASEAGGFVTDSHHSFVDYYQDRSLSDETRRRFVDIRDTVLRHVPPSWRGSNLRVADVGCGAGAQSVCWTVLGHSVLGLDVNSRLIAIARARAEEQKLAAQFVVGSATALPWASGSMHVCLVPELLEHVADWQAVCREAARVVRPGGIVFLSTTNRLCPVQEEFALPLYSWYPAALKRRYERLAITSRPYLANFATYPAVHWFTYFELRDFFNAMGFESMDRFDMMDMAAKSRWARPVIGAIRSSAPLRWLAHVGTPYTVLLARRH